MDVQQASIFHSKDARFEIRDARSAQVFLMGPETGNRPHTDVTGRDTGISCKFRIFPKEIRFTRTNTYKEYPSFPRISHLASVIFLRKL